MFNALDSFLPIWRTSVWITDRATRQGIRIARADFAVALRSVVFLRYVRAIKVFQSTFIPAANAGTAHSVVTPAIPQVRMGA